MDFVVIIMLMASVAPFVYFNLHKKWLAALQIFFLIGMWGYFFTSFVENIGPTHILFWMAFWPSMALSEIAYIMLIISMVEEYKLLKEEGQL